jgi:hypothetical protein
MAVTITHATTATLPDQPGVEINKDQWNEGHSVSGLGALAELDSVTEAEITLADNATNNATTSAHGFLKKLSNTATEFMNGAGDWATPAGSATLNGITAATADQAGISNGDWNIRWNWQKTTNSEVAFELGESAASTGGTSTSGVPNQVIGKFSTLAASTASPLQVYAHGVHAFSVSPTSTPQILARSGAAGTPTYSIAADPTTGIYSGGTGALAFAISGTRALLFGTNYADFQTVKIATVNGTAALPSLTDSSSGSYGMFFASNVTGLSVAGVENSRLIPGGLQSSKGTADATGYALNFRKSRGTVASPTVITTGDDLATINAAGYVGATGTYVTAATITADSDGTIANDSTGVGGIWRFSTRKVGGSVTERLTLDNNETADESALLISIAGAAPVRVSVGAADSGGAGFRMLRIPN